MELYVLKIIEHYPQFEFIRFNESVLLSYFIKSTLSAFEMEIFIVSRQVMAS